jgi:hypothetical protein
MLNRRVQSEEHDNTAIGTNTIKKTDIEVYIYKLRLFFHIL